MNVRPLTEADYDARWHLGRLAFGGDPAAPPEAPYEGDHVGVFDDSGRMLARASARPYEQWWGGRTVAMAGIAGVAVHPDARGQGLVGRMCQHLLRGARDRQQPVSVLFPTAPGIYRRLGWEVVGTLDDTKVPLSGLPGTAPAGTQVRSATSTDLPSIATLYAERGAASAGLLTRTGPSFVRGVEALLELDVVTVAEGASGRLTGYLGYDRRRAHDALRVWDLVAATPDATVALLASLAAWDSIVDSIELRGSTDDLALHLRGRMPAPYEAQPWMLRVIDPVGAVAARGFAPGITLSVAFALHDPLHGLAPIGYRLEVADGRGELTPTDAGDLPVLSVPGLALLYAGVAVGGRLVRAGLLDRPVVGLEEAFAGPRPEILDYF